MSLIMLISRINNVYHQLLIHFFIFCKIATYCILIADLWMNFIKFELQSGDPLKAGELHWRATKCLDSENAEEFSRRYALLQTGDAC